MGFKGTIVPDWGRFEKEGGVESPKAQQMLTGALKTFMSQPETSEFRAVAQAFAHTGDIHKAVASVQANYATPANFPTSVLEVLKKFQLTTYFDTAYEQVFDMRDYRDSNRNGFEILDVQDTMAFALVPIGMKAKLYTMSGEKVTVTFNAYAAGLSWARILFDDREYWTLENNAVAFRNKWYSSKATMFYALIDAVAAAQNVAWQAVSPAGVPNTDKDYNAIRDINTINYACQNILINCRNKGYGITPNTPFVILAPIQLKGRIARALPIVQQAFANSTERLYYNVTPYYTLGLSSSSVYYVILPKQKIIGANRMDLTIFTRFDEMSYSDHAVGWGRYAGAIGDAQQIQRCSTA